MGSIKRFDLKSLNKKYKIDFFFETGTWKGDGLAYASKFEFKKLLSCEIMEDIYKKTSLRFENNKKIHLFLGSSEEALNHLNKEIDGNCMFWLDAHYPGAEEGIHTYNEIEKETIRLPLHMELLLIKSLRPNFNDVIIVDDLRIYETGPFKGGNMPDNIIPPAKRNIDFVYELFSKSHDIIKLYDDHGYIVIVPKLKTYEEKTPLYKRLYKRHIQRIIYP